MSSDLAEIQTDFEIVNYYYQENRIIVHELLFHKFCEKLFKIEIGL